MLSSLITCWGGGGGGGGLVGIDAVELVLPGKDRF